MTASRIILCGAVLGGLGVAIGAFGAHLLPGLLTEWGCDHEEVLRRTDLLAIGVRYQMFHALALLAIGLLREHRAGTALQVAAWSLLIGVIVFSGLIYTLALTGPAWRWLGAVVPIGGLLMIAGWSALAWSCRAG
jgi:uncharacterized membrane protein YgdD (TMEM256/DUF423 family)